MTLSAIPLMAGALRLVQLAGGPELMPAYDRFASFPLLLAGSDVDSVAPQNKTDPRQESQMTSTRKIALIAGLLFLITFVAAIAGALLYAPVLHPANYIVGAGADTRVRLGAFCELILIIANVGTAVVLFPILKRQNESLALGYVAARLVECTFIAIGIVSLLAVVTLRQKAAGADAGSLVTAGKSLVAVRNWTFVLGPGFVVGVGNGLILGYLMYRSRLVPRGMARLGLVGGPLVCASGFAVVLDVIGRGSAAQGIATIPEFLWELSLGIYLTVKGFKAPPITTDHTQAVVLDDSSRPAIARPPKPAVAVR
ncbi:MAG: DUF4386 domain-containing protein [Actinomycetota bacterium]|nr:DUF4386 domain-containing protein [Actinomycetota bacterium]